MNSTKNWRKYLLGVIFSLALGLLIILATTQRTDSCTYVGEGCYKLERVEDAASRVQGLSGRFSIKQNQGMLFVFDEPNEQCMWMRDMNFALDMIWLDRQGQVLHLKENVSPDTYPESFCSDKRAKYVIELKAGEIDNSNLQLGNTVMVN